MKGENRGPVFDAIFLNRMLGAGLEPARYCYQGILSPFLGIS